MYWHNFCCNHVLLLTEGIAEDITCSLTTSSCVAYLDLSDFFETVEELSDAESSPPRGMHPQHDDGLDDDEVVAAAVVAHRVIRSRLSDLMVLLCVEDVYVEGETASQQQGKRQGANNFYCLWFCGRCCDDGKDRRIVHV